MSPKKLFRLSQIAVKKINQSSLNSTKMSKILKNDSWWNALTPTVHQAIGKYVAAHHAEIEYCISSPINISYSFTDSYGNGIYQPK